MHSAGGCQKAVVARQQQQSACSQPAPRLCCVRFVNTTSSRSKRYRAAGLLGRVKIESLDSIEVNVLCVESELCPRISNIGWSRALLQILLLLTRQGLHPSRDTAERTHRPTPCAPGVVAISLLAQSQGGEQQRRGGTHKTDSEHSRRFLAHTRRRALLLLHQPWRHYHSNSSSTTTPTRSCRR